MASEELNKMKDLLSWLNSQATQNPQPSKSMNSGSAKIDGANPSSPSTNNATRREQYNNYIKTLDKQAATSLYQTIKNYREMGLTNDQIYENVLRSANIQPAPTIATSKPSTVKNTPADLTIKGNFDLYNPIDRQSQPELMQQYYIQANNDIQTSKRSLSRLILQQDALNAKSSNVEQVTTLIDAIENAYDRGIFDAETIAKTLWVDAATVSLIQQGKANELVTLNEEYVKDQLKSYYRAEEDYDTWLQRVMEDYDLAKTNLDRQYNSAMQTLKRNLFDDKREASVGSAVAGISGSEYAVRVIEAKHQQNMDDLEWNYLYSSLTQKYSYTRAIEDYNKNIQRLSEDFDDALKDIQASVLQQFQEIDNKIGLTTAQIAQAYGTLLQNVSTAKATATTNYMKALSDGEDALANALANTYWLDTSNMTAHTFTNAELWRTWDAKTGKYNTTIWNAVNSIWHILASNDGIRIGTYSPWNWYTYNVYATRQDGLAATVWLLQRAYYGLTLEQAAQKWIGKGKNISTAKSVIQSLWLNLNDKLSDANVQAFITAIGRWEWTLWSNETLEQWLAGGKDLSSYRWASSASGGETSWSAWWYDPAKAPLYESYLQGKYTNIKDYVTDPQFQKEALAYQKAKTPQIISGFQDSLNTMVEFRNKYNELSETEKKAISLIPDKDIQEWWFWQNAALSDKQKNVLNLYRQIKAQLFIDWIIDSKKKWAAYWNLSDAEWNRISNAQSNLNVNAPSYVNYNIDKMIRDLVGDIEELWWKADTKSWYSYTQWTWQKMPTRWNQGTTLISGIQDPSVSWSQNEFSNPWRSWWWWQSSSTWGSSQGVYETIMPR